MKYYIYLFTLLFATGCSNNTEEPIDSNRAEIETKVIDSAPPLQEEVDTADAITTPKVLIVPCANGYEYNMHWGDANPSLEKYLAMDGRIILEPFPYKEMQGSGYFGVYDKKHCEQILERTDADFLVMTKMNGLGGIIPLSNDSTPVQKQEWGYSTRVLNTKSMEQFNGIRGSKLESFERIDSDVKKRASTLVDLILTSHKSN